MSHPQPASKRRAALGWTVNEDLSASRPILPERFLPPELTEADVLHRLGTFHVDQIVLVPIPPIY